MPVRRSLPKNLEEDYAVVKADYENGDLTKKGFCNKQLRLLHSHLSSDVLDSIAQIQSQLALKKLSDDEYYEKVTAIIKPQVELLFERNKTNGDKNGCESDKNSTKSDIEESKITKNYKEENQNDDDDDEDYSEPKSKRRKTQQKKKKAEKKVSIKDDNSAGRCEYCREKLDDPGLTLFQGHPNEAREHLIALTDPSLCVFDETSDEIDDAPLSRITCFSVYDQNGHLCPFDTGLVEKNVILNFSGYLKCITSEDPTPEGGIPVKEVGPINGWCINGYDGGEQATISLTTDFSEIVLMEPSEEYRPFMKTVMEKIYLVKLVIELCREDENATFEDLLNTLQTATLPASVGVLSEDQLLRHAQFICDQVLGFDDASEGTDETQLIVTPCIRTLIQLAGVTFGQRKKLIASERGRVKPVAAQKPTWSKATTTSLVRDVFENFFKGQLNEKHEGPRKKRCGVCEACQQPDCGTCTACLDMVKFGGTGKAKQACIKRRCPNKAVQDAEDSDIELDGDEVEEKVVKATTKPSWKIKVTGSGKKQIEWQGEGEEMDSKHYYKSALIGGEEVKVGDYVMVESDDPNNPPPVGKVCYMYEDMKNFKTRKCHILWFARGQETVLEELSDPQELFLLEACDDVSLNAVANLCQVKHFPISENWAMQGGCPQPTPPVDREDERSFYYRQTYDPLHARFCDVPNEMFSSGIDKYCFSCDKAEEEEALSTPNLRNLTEQGTTHEYYNCVSYEGEQYKLKSCVYVNPDCFKFKSKPQSAVQNNKRPVEDEELYPEAYRKLSDYMKGSNAYTPAPFGIGYIVAIFKKKGKKNVSASDVFLTVKKFYRPENTHRSVEFTYQLDLNKLYWSDEEEQVSLSDVQGKCFVVCEDNLQISTDRWSSRGPHRFYFNEAYNSKTEEFTNLPTEALFLGSVSKGKGKGKNQTNKPEEKDEITEWPSIARPLRCLEVFAGAGGLSRGLDKSGVARSTWAIEFDSAAAAAFKMNNPGCTVFVDDCNKILQRVIDNEVCDDKKQKLPRKGEVEMLCGGPPCQGFSGMNRFNQRQYSAFKNSLIVSYLSYCDYYRPRFFLLENVRNFVAFKNSMVLKMTMRCLTQIGYQCTFGTLQAGHFGVSQTRRRAIVLAAAPGEVLPKYPEPWTVFSPRTSQLNVTISKKTYVSTCKWTQSAPYRTITVRDVMSDLPEIQNGCKMEELPYKENALSHFQREMRKHVEKPTIISDHICKDMAPLVQARIKHIPTGEGSDWRDLPNIEVRLKDGTYTKKLQYTHNDMKNGKSSTGALRGVCSCATSAKTPCDPLARQFGTLIPWCLPHTGNRHNNWCGLYGRLQWNGFFSTTITNPEPMGKQGRVLHPEQHRVVSVRECARSQGFPDHHKFHGTILEKHRQVGNAVPPPMGEALGREIKRALAEKEKKVEEKKKAEEESVKQTEEEQKGQEETEKEEPIQEDEKEGNEEEVMREDKNKENDDRKKGEIEDKEEDGKENNSSETSADQEIEVMTADETKD
ncbi:hypothetical protein M8J76_016131 [Diaphorina citri]|nr:hypothetical protein M8J76_016131 [Diaphorina citri]